MSSLNFFLKAFNVLFIILFKLLIVFLLYDKLYLDLDTLLINAE